jgi:hypothetical protein
MDRVKYCTFQENSGTLRSETERSVLRGCTIHSPTELYGPTAQRHEASKPIAAKKNVDANENCGILVLQFGATRTDTTT